MNKTTMQRQMGLGLSAMALGLVATPLMADEPEQCQTVRFAEVGWTDITATTALTTEVLEAMGYQTRIDTVSVPIAYQGMKNDDFDAFDLGDWELVDSSEAGMLAELSARVPREKWMVFLGWEPHPMNTNFDMAYLEGAGDYFGPDLGGATVYTNTRRGYVQECANVGALLEN
ncbi:MAG: glycine betaine ABC transporter substrate-binding protein, partial [Halomonas sp.]